MTALLGYGIDINSGVAQFAIVADDTTARYVWPALGDQLWDDQRIQDIAKMRGAPEDAQGWYGLAAYNLGLETQITDPHTVSDIESARAEARGTLNDGYAELGTGPKLDPPVLTRARQSFDQVSADYPGFGEDVEDDDPQAMNNFVLNMLGGIDPDGPNAWILDSQAGDDEDPEGFVQLPGYDYNMVPTPDDAATETTPDGEE